MCSDLRILIYFKNDENNSLWVFLIVFNFITLKLVLG
jgi:hypothetical protein